MLEKKKLPAADWAYLDAGALVQALQKKEISALELTDQFIARIEALDGEVNAVVVRDFDRARERAKAADAAIARGETKKLIGVPVTIKESYHMAGLPTTWGRPQFKGWMPKEDALAVKRLTGAGAIILGKTNVPLNLGDWQSYNEIYGTTHNPWNKAHTPGGSSGGSSAALAAGFGPISIGSDIGGSLRVPAHFCGICAHKPTFGIIPSRGHIVPGLPEWLTGRDLAVIGPMTRSVDDLETTLDIMAGPDEAGEGLAYRLELPPARHEALADFRVLYIAEHPLLPTDSSLRGELDRLAQRLEEAGVKVARQSPLLPDLSDAARIYMRLLNAVFSAGFPEDLLRELQSRVAGLDAADRSLHAEFLRGAVMSHREWVFADVARQGLRQRWRALFQEFDVVICPPSPTPAFPQDQSPSQEARKIMIDDKEFPYSMQLVWAESAISCGLPATVIPIGVTEAGLPVGLQIIGPAFEDRTPLAFARLIEREIDTRFVPPGY